MYGAFRLLPSFIEVFQENAPVLFVAEDVNAVITAYDDVLGNVRKVDSGKPRHASLQRSGRRWADRCES
jgi:hypothetical protein